MIDRFALSGRIVTMNESRQVLKQGTIWIHQERIISITDVAAPAPAGFETIQPIQTNGTIYPGMIELHNHLSYNILPLWQVPKKFTNRGQWRIHKDYSKLVTRPMAVLNNVEGVPEAIVRYVECKCLMGGVTTSQGIRLSSNAGIRVFYRGLVRNVEVTDSKQLPPAGTSIPDVASRDVAAFLKSLQKRENKSAFILHLSEGIDSSARKHFSVLKMADGNWAINSSLAGIHCNALTLEDFKILKQFGASMVWSPLSNLLLYGKTADIVAAKSSGVLMGLGSDWSPSGSKNLLGELKIAHLVNQELGGIFSAQELVAMATINGAKILKWDKQIGSLEAGKLADLIVMDGKILDPYLQFIQAKESTIQLSVIGGIARYGNIGLMNQLQAGTEKVTVGGKQKLIHFENEAGGLQTSVTLANSIKLLSTSMNNLPELSKPSPVPLNAAVRSRPRPTGFAMKSRKKSERWKLVLDHTSMDEILQRPFMAFAKKDDAPASTRKFAATAIPPLIPLELEAITLQDDSGFIGKLQSQVNLPDFIKRNLT